MLYASQLLLDFPSYLSQLYLKFDAISIVHMNCCCGVDDKGVRVQKAAST